jgi:hypothetical protein
MDNELDSGLDNDLYDQEDGETLINPTYPCTSLNISSLHRFVLNNKNETTEEVEKIKDRIFNLEKIVTSLESKIKKNVTEKTNLTTIIKMLNLKIKEKFNQSLSEHKNVLISSRIPQFTSKKFDAFCEKFSYNKGLVLGALINFSIDQIDEDINFGINESTESDEIETMEEFEEGE